MAEQVDIRTAEDAERAPEQRIGLNASEDAVAWALAHFGADHGLVESLGVETRDGICDRLDSLPEQESELLLGLEAWRERARRSDRIESRVELSEGKCDPGSSERWRRRVEVLCTTGPEPGPGPSVRAQLAVVRSMVADAAALEWPDAEEPAGPLGLVLLDSMREPLVTHTLTAMGVWQIAGLVAGRGRRRAARVRSKLPNRWTDVFQAGLSGNQDLAIEAATRLQEVYLGLRRRDFDFDQTAVRLGLFTITSAAGGRFEHRLSVWLGRAPEDTARIARQLSRINRRATRLRVGPAFRRSLEAFWGYWREHIEREEATDE
ncbi:MAG: hypothetical protein ACQEVA_03265 [Myxococcota bacterium]